MAYKVESVFPDSIDDLPFISDVDIPNKDIMINIQNYIDQVIMIMHRNYVMQVTLLQLILIILTWFKIEFIRYKNI